MFFTPAPFLLTTALALAAGVWFWRRTTLRGRPRIAAAALRTGAAALLCWILSDPRETLRVDASPAAPVILVDGSLSMDFPASSAVGASSRLEAAQSAAAEIGQRGGALPRWFAGETSDEPFPENAPQRHASLLASALRQFLTSENPPSGIVVISDGAVQDQSDLPLAGDALARRGTAVATFLTGGEHAARNVSITACDAPSVTRPGARIPVTATVRRDGCRDRVLQVLIQDALGKTVSQANAVPGETQELEQSVTLTIDAGAGGFSGKLLVTPLDGETTLVDNELPLRITAKAERPRVLYMEGTPASVHGIPEPFFLTEALDSDGIDVDLLVMNTPDSQGKNVLKSWDWKGRREFQADNRKGYPATREELYRYDAVICSDIPRAAFTEDQIKWTVNFVAERGGAFVMVGGKSSFGSGLWDQTPWDNLIPLDMAGAERGLTFDQFKPFWPQEALRHPLLTGFPLQSGETLEAILHSHPLFLGTNFVNRAKPAATVIMRQGKENGMPVMAVQPFGKGRTMGFASDVTFFWGTLHNRAWGPPETAVPVEALVEDPVYKRTPARFYNNAYFRRFWVRSLRWLTEGSLRLREGEFTAATPRPVWTRGTKLPVTASIADDALLAKLAKGACTAKIEGGRGERTRLRFNAATRRFEGLLSPPTNAPEECVITVEATATGVPDTLRSSFTVRVPAMDPELADSNAAPEILAALAQSTGGKTLRSTTEAVAWLRARQASAEFNRHPVEVRTPSWSRPWVLASLLLLLSAEWLLRRLFA